MRPFDVDRIQSAAQRYESRTGRKPTERVIATFAPSRPADQRKQYLSGRLSQEKARTAVLEAEARGAPRDAGETLASLARERIIGTPDLVNINYLELAIAVGRAVCRIRIGSEAGSGFLVGPRVLMTNHHVIESKEDARQAEAQFDYQENRSGELLPVEAFRMDPELFFVTHPDLDFTLIGLAGASAKGRRIESYPWLQLIGQLGKADKGDPLNIIQHPRGGLKQIALRNNEIIEIPDGKRDFLYYTTDTEPGSSGSPCFNDQWELVALHHSGVPRIESGQILRKDGAPWRKGVDDIALIDWIANEGARISAIVDALKSAALSAGEEEVRSRMLSDQPPNPVELAREGAARSGSRPGSASAAGVALSANGGAPVSFTVPLTITVSLGDRAAVRAEPAAAPRARTDDADVSSAVEKVEIDPDWSNRKGYDARFLGFEIPLPRLSTTMKQVTVVVPPEHRRNGNKYVLHYHHYSLAMNKVRRFAWYSAAIVDGKRRFELPKRDDKWFIDPRIDDPEAPRFQCGEELYAANRTDRGHLARYLDVAWGDTKDEAVRATNDTFHFTNCCLQLSGFNQGKSRWQGLERYLLELKAKKELRRIVVITGPIFADSDPVYRNEHMDYSIAIPVQFWKVCAIVRDDGSLAATGFVLGQQDITSLPGFEEAFDVTAAQVTLDDLEERTGLAFGVLTTNDHFAGGGDPGTLEIARPGGGKRLVKPLRSPEEIVV